MALPFSSKWIAFIVAYSLVSCDDASYQNERTMAGIHGASSDLSGSTGNVPDGSESKKIQGGSSLPAAISNYEQGAGEDELLSATPPPNSKGSTGSPRENMDPQEPSSPVEMEVTQTTSVEEGFAWLATERSSKKSFEVTRSTYRYSISDTGIGIQKLIGANG